MNIPSRWLFLALLPVFHSGVAVDEPLGRLFYTPQQRATLDLLRENNATSNLEKSGNSLTVNGEIWRKGIRRGRWINGEIENEPGTPSLPVGDHYERHSGKRENLLGDGKVSIKQHIRAD